MTTTNKQPLPGPIAQKLDEVRQVLRSYLTKKWLYMLVCWLLLVFWLGAAVDYLPVRVGSDETPRAARIGFLAIMALGSLWLLLGWLLPRLLRPVTDASVALLIERKQPELGNRFITAVQVSNAQADVTDQASHAQMFQQVLAEASESASSVNVEQLFNWRPLNLYRAAAIAGCIGTLIAAVVAWPWFSQWNARLFGLSDAPWPRSAVLRADWLQLALPTFTGQLSAQQTQIEFVKGLARIPAGSSPRLQISADSSAPKLPEVCTLHYRSDDATRGRANLRRIGAPRDGWQQFSLDGPPLDTVSTSMSVDIVGLDARLRNMRLEVVEPVVVMDMQLECTYPSYLIDSLSTRPKKETLSYRSGMKIPEGTVCTLVGLCSSELKQVDYTNNSSTTDAAEVSIQQASVDQKTFRIALGALESSQLVEIRLLDQYGLPSEQVSRYNISVQVDTVPEVASRLEGIGLEITPKAILPVRGRVTDDHEIAEVALEMSKNETGLPAIALDLSDSNIAGNIDLEKMASEGRLVIDAGVTLGLSVRAIDRYDLGGQQHIGRGQPQQLAVVSEGELLKRLDRQENELRRRLEQIISEVQQLDEAMKNLAEQLMELETAGVQKIGETLQPFVAQQDSARADSDKQDANKAAERQSQQRLAILRAQQAQLQTDKSRQELIGIANRVENLRLQLVNNRIDSVDRQQRLLEQVEKPLGTLLAGDYAKLDQEMGRLQSAVAASRGLKPAEDSVELIEKVLESLEAIKTNMTDILSFNEFIETVRTLLDEQERLLQETQKIQVERTKDLFK